MRGERHTRTLCFVVGWAARRIDRCKRTNNDQRLQRSAGRVDTGGVRTCLSHARYTGYTEQIRVSLCWTTQTEPTLDRRGGTERERKRERAPSPPGTAAPFPARAAVPSPPICILQRPCLGERERWREREKERERARLYGGAFVVSVVRRLSFCVYTQQSIAYRKHRPPIVSPPLESAVPGRVSIPSPFLDTHGPAVGADDRV